jgi:catechol 2,3-dioxygenase-like lactoylglutathione lyase family enzyme
MQHSKPPVAVTTSRCKSIRSQRGPVKLTALIDHVTIRVSDFEASKAFYSTVLAPLGQELGWEDPELKLAEWGDFSIAADGKPLTQEVHVAFAAKSREEVDAFHRAALEAGYRDNGPPGERAIYHEGYYGAFVLDPDGNNVEAVFHDR